jgi:hypothetical protein
LDTQLSGLANSQAAVLEDTGTSLPALISSLDTGGATPSEIWDYLIAPTGDDAATRIAVAVAAQSVLSPFQVAVGAMGPTSFRLTRSTKGRSVRLPQVSGIFYWLTTMTRAQLANFCPVWMC